MTYLIETTKEDLVLARAEIESFAESRKYNNYFIVSEKVPFDRFALTNAVYKLVTLKDLDKTKIYKIIGNNSFAIVKKLKSLGFLLDVKQFNVILLVFGNRIYKKIYHNDKAYLQRDPKYRPEFHPAACTAKLACIIINLAGATKGALYDPFCGTGGILIEGSFMGLDVKGSDLNRIMVNRSNINLKHYGFSPLATEGDALTLTNTYDAIVTELPFGKTTKMDRSVTHLLDTFLGNIFRNTKTKRLVLVLPDARYKFKQFNVLFTRKIYIHKSLSKRIYVLDRV